MAHGELFGLLGPNGAGKTTLIHCLLGLLRARAGHIEINGSLIQDERRTLAGTVALAPWWWARHGRADPARHGD